MNPKVIVASVFSALCLAVAASQTMFLAGEKLVSTGCLYANPTWHDIDGDGQNELLVGVKREYKKPDGTRDYFEGQVLVFRNTGTASAPVFAFTDLDSVERFGINGTPLAHRQDASVENYTGCWGMQVAFGDVDGDGYEDVVQGGLFGEITVYRGTAVSGTYENAEFFASTNAPLRHVKRAHVGLWDVDGDGSDELVVGYMNSFSDDISTNVASMAVYKYEKGSLTGGATLKDRSGTVLTVPNENLETFPVISYTSRTGPTFTDINGDGWADLVTGTSPGGIFYFAAEATNALGVSSSWRVTAVNIIPDGPTGQLGETNPPRSRVFAADVTGDGFVDLLVGYADGSVYLYRGTDAHGFILPCEAYPDLVAGVAFNSGTGMVVGVEGAASVKPTGLPSGLSLKKDGDGRYHVAGTPDKVGSATVRFGVLDSRSRVLATREVRFDVRAPVVEFDMDPLYVLTPGVATNIPVKVLAECAYKVTSSALPSGLKFVSTGGAYAFAGTPTTPGEKVVTLKVTYVTNQKEGKSIQVRLLVDNFACDEIPLAAHYDNLIAGVPVADFTLPGAIGCTAKLPSGLGLSFDKTTGALTGTPKAPGKYLVTFTRKVTEPVVGSSKTVTRTCTATTLFVVYQGLGDHSGDRGVIAPALTISLPEVDPKAVYQCAVGVGFETPIVVSGGLSGVAEKVRVDGLPRGLSYKNGVITGVPLEAGTKTVVISASNAFGWTSEPFEIEFQTKALPVWAYGTYNGAVTNDFLRGIFSMTVSSVGKISGKIVSGGKTYGFSSASYSAADGADYLFEASLTVDGKPVPVTFRVFEDLYVDASLTTDGVTRTLGRVAADGDVAVEGVQNLWKRPDTKLYLLPTFVSGLKMPLNVMRGELTLSFANGGTVKVSGQIDGKSVSTSTVLLLDSFAIAKCGCYDFGYNGRVFVNFPSVSYFTLVDVTLGPDLEPKTKYDITLDCPDIRY